MIMSSNEITIMEVKKEYLYTPEHISLEQMFNLPIIKEIEIVHSSPYTFTAAIPFANSIIYKTFYADDTTIIHNRLEPLEIDYAWLEGDYDE